MNLIDIKKIYFVGIGGIGMSALARYFLLRGVEVYGYDKTETILTKELAAEGMKVHYTDDVALVPPNVDLVVYTPAIPKEHKELNYFLSNNILVKKRSEVLGIISQSMKCIAVAGTHGKTSTSSLLVWILRCGGIDCTAFLGGIAKNYDSNFISGKSDWVIIEADEYDRSFLQLFPEISIVTALDADHLDIYGTHETMVEAYQQFMRQTQKIIFAHDDIEAIVLPNSVQFLKYGSDGGEYRSQFLRVRTDWFVFNYVSPLCDMTDIKFTQPGKYNAENATAAISVALHLGVSEENIRAALASFKGIKRRFEFVYKSKNVTYIDDYAHHPKELTAAIGAARMIYPDRKITGVFQPHLFTRTRDFAKDFGVALSLLDEVILLEIYPARELPIEGVTSQIIFDEIKTKNKKLVTKNNLIEELSQKDISVLMTLGAGDIDTFVPQIKSWLEEEKL